MCTLDCENTRQKEKIDILKPCDALHETSVRQGVISRAITGNVMNERLMSEMYHISSNGVKCVNQLFTSSGDKEIGFFSTCISGKQTASPLVSPFVFLFVLHKRTHFSARYKSDFVVFFYILLGVYNVWVYNVCV